MAHSALHGRYGKDKVGRGGGSESYISEALMGGHGKSEEIVDKSIGHGQTIKRAFAMDNLDKIMDVPTSLRDGGVTFHGGENNIAHSLHGASVVNDDMLASGPVKHQFNKGI